MEDDQEFAHAGGERELLGFPAGAQAFVKGPDPRVVARGDQGPWRAPLSSRPPAVRACFPAETGINILVRHWSRLASMGAVRSSGIGRTNRSSSRNGMSNSPVSGIVGFRLRYSSIAPARTSISRNPRRW